MHSILYFPWWHIIFLRFMRKKVGRSSCFFPDQKAAKRKLNFSEIFLEIGRYHFTPEKKKKTKREKN